MHYLKRLESDNENLNYFDNLNKNKKTKTVVF